MTPSPSPSPAVTPHLSLPHVHIHIPAVGVLAAFLVIGLVLALVIASRFSRAEVATARRRAFPIHAYIGANGGGKSLCMVLDTLPTLAGQWWECENDSHAHTVLGVTSGFRLVYSTVPLLDPETGLEHPRYRPLDDYRTLLRLEHSDVLLDEVTGVASSRSSSGMPPQVSNKLVQLRRADVLLRWTAPAWARADTIIRECSQAVTDCRGMFPVTKRPAATHYHGPHGECSVLKPHVHRSATAWRSRRLFGFRTYDAAAFEEWTQAKRVKLKPACRQVFRRVGSPAERAYDTLGAVMTLGVVNEAGLCIDCGGKRAHRGCSCGTVGARSRARARA